MFLTEKYKNEAALVNLTWLKRIDSTCSQYQYKCGCTDSKQMSNVRAKLRSGKEFPDQCSACETSPREDNLSELLERYGGKLLGLTGNRRTRKVELPCKHVEEVWVKSIQTLAKKPWSKIKCNQCIFENYRCIGMIKGVRPLHHMNEAECAQWDVKYGDYWLWEFIECKHQRPYQPTIVRNGDIHCKVCIEERHNQLASSSGFECLGEPRDKEYDSNYRYYRRKKCGHEMHIARSDVEHGNPQCQICRENKWSENAKRCGWTFLRKGEKHGTAIYKHDACGAEEERHRSEFGQGATYVNCRNCGVTTWSEKSFVYLYEIRLLGKHWLKLGHAINPDIRYKKYGLDNNADVKLLTKREFKDRHEAKQFEQVIGAEVEEYRLCSEKMSVYHTKNGKTECFDILVKDHLMSLIDSSRSQI